MNRRESAILQAASGKKPKACARCGATPRKPRATKTPNVQTFAKRKAKAMGKLAGEIMALAKYGNSLLHADPDVTRAVQVSVRILRNALDNLEGALR